MNHDPTCSWADPDQRRVAQTLDEHHRILIEAAPGTGKTFTTIYLALLAARNGISSRHRPSIILTFSNNARTQLEQEREAFITTQRMTKAEARTIRIENYHALYLDILRHRRGAWGCTSTLRPATERERNDRITRALPDATPEQEADASKQSLLRPPGTLSTPQQDRLRAEAVQAIRHGRPHYDDFAPLVHHLLRCSPKLLDWLRTFPLVLLDEFQDTDEEQCAILKLWNPKRIGIFYDRYQMIYAFRGADPRRPAEIAEFFGITKTLTLTTLHRAKQHNSLAHFITTLRTDNLGGAHITPAQRPWLRIIENDDGLRRYHQRSEYEVRYHAHIRRDETTAILTRKNELAIKLQQALLGPPGTRPDAPFYSCALVGGPRQADERLRDAIYDLRGITTAAALREWTGTLLDDVNVKPYQRSKKPVYFRTEFSKTQPLQRATGVLGTIRDELVRWHPAPDDPTAIMQALDHVLRWAKLLAVRRHADPDRRFYLTRLRTAAAGAASWDTACDALETALLTGRHYRRMRQHGITICTVHQSKGREFNHVIIPWIGWPEAYDKKSDEDRRLLYVALTRAKDRVTIITPAEQPPTILTAWRLR